MVKVKLEFDMSQYNISDNVISKIKTKTLNLTTSDLIRNLRKESPVDTGRLQGSWMSFNNGDNEREVKTSTIYADFLDKGTGLYGPRKKLITPKKQGGVLVFTPHKGKFAGKTVFAQNVKGIKPVHFVSRSMNATKEKIEDFAIQAIMEA